MATVIFTDRLSLAPLAHTDSKFIYKLLNTQGWLTFIGDRNIHSEEDAAAYIKKTNDNPCNNFWIARLKTNNASIGIVSFIKRDYLEYHDIGYAFLPLYTSHGYAYEASRALLHHVMETGTHARISSITQENNLRAIKLVKKLGLKFVKDIKVENETLQLYDASIDRIAITGLTESFFSIFTNKENRKPNLDLLKSICIPEVLIINRYRSKLDIYNLESFIDSRRQILTAGTLSQFEEREISEDTSITKGIAVRSSDYEKKGIAYRMVFRTKGRKVFHFVKVKESWKISSILWEDDDSLN
jgi:RimJ/RimL family protein N-acetyltransferase